MCDVVEEVSKFMGGLGVMVVVCVVYFCMVSRGVEKSGSSTCIVMKFGCFVFEFVLCLCVWECFVLVCC